MIFNADGCSTNNSTKSNACISADILGDWREEVLFRTSDSKSIRVYCTNYDTDIRLTTLMHDVQYRTQVAGEQNCYNQPPHTSFYLGSDKPLPDRPAVTINGSGTGSLMTDYTNAENSLVYAPDTVTVSNNAMKIGETDLLSGLSYTIVNKNSKMVLDLTERKTDDGTNVQQWTGNGGSNQQWRIVEQKDGYCAILSMKDEAKCIAVAESSANDGVNVELQSFNGKENQLWKLVKDGSYYGIVSKCSADKAGLDVYDWSVEDGGNINQWEYWGGDCQLWSVKPNYPAVNDGTYTIKNLNSGLYVSDDNGNTVQGNTMNWTFKKNSDNTYCITDESGKALTVENNSADDGANISLSAFKGDNSQKFTLKCNKDGTYTILTVASEGKRCVDVFEISTESGANICQWEYWDGDGQKFIIEPIVQKKAEPETLIGDINADGKVETADIVMLKKFLVKSGELTEKQLIAADINKDNKINVFDFIILKKLLMK